MTKTKTNTNPFIPVYVGVVRVGHVRETLGHHWYGSVDHRGITIGPFPTRAIAECYVREEIYRNEPGDQSRETPNPYARYLPDGRELR